MSIASLSDPAAALVVDQGTPAPAADSALIDDLVAANRILFAQAVVDAFGHVSARHDKQSDRFLLSRNLAPGTVTADDIVEFDLDGAPVTAKGRRIYLERFIHSEIYKARPDVMAIVHSHSVSVVPFSVVPSVPLRAVCHMCGFLGTRTPIFEIREASAEPTDLLITNHHLGKALAASLGGSSAVLMRGHGSTVVASSLRLAVYRAVYTETNAKLQSEAMRLGPVVYLTQEEAATAARSVETQVTRAWDLWKSQAPDPARMDHGK